MKREIISEEASRAYDERLSAEAFGCRMVNMALEEAAKLVANGERNSEAILALRVPVTLADVENALAAAGQPYCKC